MNPNETISTDQQIIVDWIDNYFICEGIDSYIREKKSIPFENVYEVKDIQTLGEFKAETTAITKSQDYSDFMATQAYASASGWGASVSASSSFLRERKVKTTSLDYLISTKYLRDRETLNVVDYHNLKFNDHARGLLQKKDYANFKKLYGDSFIMGFITGGFYIGNVHIETKEEHKKEELEAEMKASFSTIGFSGEGGAAFQKKLEENSSTFEMSVFIVGDGHDPKQINIGDVNQMIIDAGNLENSGKKRLYAVITSYEYLADYINIVNGEYNIIPDIPPNVTNQINSIFYSLLYALNTIPEAKRMVEELMDNDAEKLKMISNLESILTSSFMNNDIPFGGTKWKNPDNYLRILVKSVRLGNQVYYYKPSEKTFISNLIAEFNKKIETEILPSPSPYITNWINEFRKNSNVEIAKQTVMLLDYANIIDSPRKPWGFNSSTLKKYLNILKSLYHIN